MTYETVRRAVHGIGSIGLENATTLLKAVGYNLVFRPKGQSSAAGTEEALAPLAARMRSAAEKMERAAARLARQDSTGIPADRAAFTLEEVAELVNLEVDEVRRHFEAGELNGRHSGDRILIWRWSLLEFLGL